MNLDDKIKHALKMDQQEIQQILSNDDGLLSRFSGVFSGSMKMWNIFGLTLSVIIAGMMFWFGYEFFISQTLEDRVYWGFLSVAAIVMSLGIKIWLWMELNRMSTIKEIKRVELAVAQFLSNTKSQ